MAILQNTSFLGTSTALTLPTGTTAQRPVPAAEGMLRFNTSIGRAEVFISNAWEDVLSGTGNTLMYLPLFGDTATNGDITDTVYNVVGTLSGTTTRNYLQSSYRGLRTASGCLDIINPAIQQLSGNPLWTIEFWLYDENTGAGGTSQTKLEFCGYEPGLLYRYSATAGNGCYWRANPLGFATTTANAWHHHAIVGLGSTLRQYIDGVQVADTGGTPGESRWASRLPADGYLNRQVRIGASNHTDFSGQHTVGTFRKFKVSSTARYTANFTPADVYPIA
jgi:hypothetical protein